MADDKAMSAGRARSAPLRPALRLLVLMSALGLGLALGAIIGFRTGLGLWAHLIYPHGTGAPGPEVLPGLIVAIVFGIGGAVVGAAVSGGTLLVTSAAIGRRRLSRDVAGSGS